MTDTTRDAFEAWARKECSATSSDLRWDEHGYIWNEWQRAFNAWQAAKEQDKRQPLTVARIREVWDAQLFHITDLAMAIDFAQDIESAHGIKQ